MSIPKRIFTNWFGGEPNDLIKRCIKSQQIPGYEHHLITLDTLLKDSRYINEAIAAEKLGNKRWCKVSDLCRAYYLYNEGGIFLDADMEILPGKNFDNLLDTTMFCGVDEENNNASSVMGAVQGHPLLHFFIQSVEENFRGDGGWIWEPGMQYFSKVVNIHNQKYQFDTNLKVKQIPADFFFPYHWREKTINFTENTIVYHHYCGSWNY